MNSILYSTSNLLVQDKCMEYIGLRVDCSCKYYIGCIKMLGQMSGVTSPHQNKKKKFLLVCAHKHSVCKVQPPCTLILNISKVYLWANLKIMAYSAPMENNEAFHQCSFYACQTICNCPGAFERVQQPKIRCVHGFTDSGGGYFEHLLWTVTWWTVRTQEYWIGNVHSKCIMSVVRKILQT